LGVVVVLLVVVLAYLASTRTEEISITIKDDYMSLSYSSGASFEIGFMDILSLMEAQDLELGKFVSGSETGRYKFGVWNNPQFGEYNLSIYANVARYIVVETSEQIYVMNFESEDATDSFYRAFLELLQNRKAPATP
jgi:hypothetical protein